MPERFQPALWGGLFIGVLSALPFVNLGNCCCCLWVILGGVLATYLRQQNTPFQLQASEGALLGLVAGAIGGVIGQVLSIPLEMMMGPLQQEFIQRMLENNPDLPSEVRDAMGSATAVGAVRVVSALVSIFISTVFGMLGGLLGVAIFKKNLPPPPPPGTGTIEVLPPV
jgi:uncharacterized protein YqgC (DUF456 family)